MLQSLARVAVHYVRIMLTEKEERGRTKQRQQQAQENHFQQRVFSDGV